MLRKETCTKKKCVGGWLPLLICPLENVNYVVMLFKSFSKSLTEQVYRSRFLSCQLLKNIELIYDDNHTLRTVFYFSFILHPLAV